MADPGDDFVTLLKKTENKQQRRRILFFDGRPFPSATPVRRTPASRPSQKKQ
jgi:hypothetical protein